MKLMVSVGKYEPVRTGAGTVYGYQYIAASKSIYGCRYEYMRVWVRIYAGVGTNICGCG